MKAAFVVSVSGGIPQGQFQWVGFVLARDRADALSQAVHQVAIDQGSADNLILNATIARRVPNDLILAAADEVREKEE